MFYSVGQAGIGQMSWMRMPPSMLGKIITITRNGRSEQVIFTTSVNGLFLSQYITNKIIQ